MNTVNTVNTVSDEYRRFREKGICSQEDNNEEEESKKVSSSDVSELLPILFVTWLLGEIVEMGEIIQ